MKDCWIDVNLRLPKSGYDVIVYCPENDKGYRVTMGKYWSKKDSGGRAHWIVLAMGVFDYTKEGIVTAWQPRPLKPKIL